MEQSSRIAPQTPNMQERRRKAAHQSYRDGAVHRVGTCVIGKLMTDLFQCSKVMTRLK